MTSGALGASGCLLGVSWVSPGCLLGASWVPPGCLLGVSWVSPWSVQLAQSIGTGFNPFLTFLARLGLKPGAWPWSSIPVD
jgi:hypothetical protein